jgi:hypothetical protein
MDPHPCDGCNYYYGLYHNTKCCNYLLDTNRRRPCPFGQGCTVKKLRPKGGAKGVSGGKKSHCTKGGNV